MTDTTETTETTEVVDPQLQPGYCPTCEVIDPDPCRTPSGRRSKTEHPTRKSLRNVDGDTTTTDEKESPAEAPQEAPAPKGYTDEQVAEAINTANLRLEEHKPIPNTKVRILVWALEQKA